MSERRLSKRSSDADDKESTKRVKGLKEPPGKQEQALDNSKASSSSRTPPENGQNGVPGRSSGGEAQIKNANYPVGGRLDFRLKEYVDQDGKERLFMGVVPHGRLHPNMITPVQGFNTGIYMGICPLGITTTLDAAVSMAGAFSEHRHLPHMPHVFFMVAPIAKHPSGEEGTLSSRYDRIFLSSSQQHINLPPKNSEMERLNRERDHAIQVRAKAIKERDRAIQVRNNQIAQAGNPYIGHNPIELVGRYASSESHTLLCKGFMKKWEDDSLECRDKLENATGLRARHSIIKASLDDIYQLSQEFEAQAKWMSARHTSPSSFDGENSIG